MIQQIIKAIDAHKPIPEVSVPDLMEMFTIESINQYVLLNFFN